MRKLFFILTTLVIFLSPFSYSYSQEEIDETFKEDILEDNIERKEEVEKEKTLKDTLNESTEEEIVIPKRPFLVVLSAILIPAIFISFFYLILKFFKF